MAVDRAMLIVGAGLAGGNAAVSLREEGYRGRVIVVGDEPALPFGRPPLSKTYLRGEEDLTGWLVKPTGWYTENQVELLTTTVSRLDPTARQASLASGQVIDYEQLLLATGGRNRRLNVPGADLPGVHQLRTLAEADALRAAARPGRRAVVVGMGFIGCEVAASLIQMGLQVSAILPGAAPLAAVLGPEMGEVLAGVHREHGVELLTGDQVVAFAGAESLSAVKTQAQLSLACDLAVVGIGIEPVLGLAERTSIELDNGILVDERLRTSADHVYAAGDVANHLHPLFGRIRVEHFNNAERQGRAAGRAMLGDETPFAYIHSFWSDQYEHNLEYVGHVREWDQFLVRGSLEERKLLGFYLQAGKLRAAVGLNRGGDPEAEPESEMAACARLIAEGAAPPISDLANDHVDLWSLAAAPS